MVIGNKNKGSYNRKRNDVICNYCHEYGHLKFKCPNKKKGN